MHQLAVIADPHYFDLFPGYGFAGARLDGRAGAAIHTLADSAASTRLFNESYFALPAALEACVARGMRTVLIAGDLTDDGQISAMEGALALLADYERRHGMRFFLTPGNHDAYGMSGRDITRRLMDGEGGQLTVTSTLRPKDIPPGVVLLEPRQRCQDYRALLEQWAGLGLKRRAEDLHWETPFGSDDRFEARLYDIASPDGATVHSQLDVSYLVEPEPGLWLMSIDANVFVPRSGCPDNSDPEAFEDSTCAGWAALVQHKPFILAWMRDVAQRADRLGKTLLCFSHYPAIDPLDGTRDLEAGMLGDTMSVQRTPSVSVSQAICATGVHTHFSGHMHIYDRAEISVGSNRLVNYALPSLVAFPAAIGFVSAQGRQVAVGFEPLEAERFAALLPAYRGDAQGGAGVSGWLEAATYGDYLFGQIEEQVVNRILPREWPQELSAFIASGSLRDLAARTAMEDPVPDITLIRFVADLHALRMGSEIALEHIPAARLDAYRTVAAHFAASHRDDVTGLEAQIQTILAMFERFATKGHAVEWMAAVPDPAAKERA